MHVLRSLLTGIQCFAVLAAVNTTAGQSLLDSPRDEHEPFADFPLYELPPSVPNGEAEPADRAPPVRSFPEPTGDPSGASLVNGVDFGDPRRLVFQGLSRFSEGQLKAALACDPEFQMAARPSGRISDLL